MATIPRPARAKAAQRVVEVLDFFDERHRQATVMDIARHYHRPQSSTSELLASLVELGLLYKDPSSRTYTLTPRAAILGSLSQPRLVRDGRLASLVEELSEETGLGVALIGMVGPNAQVFRWTAADDVMAPGCGRGLASGAQEKLTDTAAGWLLLSTLPQARREGLVRRLNAEAAPERKFSYPEMIARLQDCSRSSTVTGPVGFGVPDLLTAVLLSEQADERPMAIGLVHPPSHDEAPERLLQLLRQSVRRCVGSSFNPRLAPVAANAA